LVKNNKISRLITILLGKGLITLDLSTICTFLISLFIFCQKQYFF